MSSSVARSHVRIIVCRSVGGEFIYSGFEKGSWQTRTRQYRKDLWIMAAYRCLIEFHGVLARRKKNL